METKELIFNGKKFFEGQIPNYIGKTASMPNSSGILGYILRIDGGSSFNLLPYYDMPRKAYSGKIVGQFTQSNEVYILALFSDEHGGLLNWDNHPVVFDVTNILQNGGSIE